jgi:tetraprenyl-beta-curcumene synthase
MARIAPSLIRACWTYRRSLAPLVGAEMRRWDSQAEALPDPERRRIAIEKLDGERFNAEAAAMAATVAQPAYRAVAVEAIVAVEVMFDYLDGVSERPSPDPIADRERVHAPLLRVFAPAPPADVESARQAALPAAPPAAPASVTPLVADASAQDPYLEALSQRARAALARLPARSAIDRAALRCATAAVEAQARMHAVAEIGAAELESWARGKARRAAVDSGPVHVEEADWRDVAAGAACSVLALHALIAAAASPATTEAVADRLCDAYAALGTAVTLLDGLADAHHDAGGGSIGYAGLYESPQHARIALTRATRSAQSRLAKLSDANHHLTMLWSSLAFELANARAAAPSPSRAAALAFAREHRRQLLWPSCAIGIWRGLQRAETDARAPSPLLTRLQHDRERSHTC